MSKNDLDEMRRIGFDAPEWWGDSAPGKQWDAGRHCHRGRGMIRRILHRLACAWMQCDEARG